MENVEMITEEDHVDKEYDFDPFHKGNSLSSLIGISMHDKILPSLPLKDIVISLPY